MNAMTRIGKDRDPEAATERLLSAAASVELCEFDPFRGDESNASLKSLSQVYLDWIFSERGVAPDDPDRREKTSLLLHCLVGAQTLGDALGLCLRFGRTLWENKGYREIRDTGDQVEISIAQLNRPGTAGLIMDLWTIALNLSQLEWLVGRPLDGVSAKVRNPLLIDPSTLELFFGHPLVHDPDDLALIIPRRHLARPVIARTQDITRFCEGLPLSTLVGAKGPQVSMRTLVANLVRKDRMRMAAATTLESVSARLGQSQATLRRHLRAEGTGFREVSEAVVNELAKGLLADRSLTIDTVAFRSGYSDAYAFRRYFRRLNGCSPSAYRRERLAAAECE